ncbi:MAG TPA: hypothetical protein VIV06_11125 [Candidatus Limnocylindrales bacterium]
MNGGPTDAAGQTGGWLLVAVTAPLLSTAPPAIVPEPRTQTSSR